MCYLYFVAHKKIKQKKGFMYFFVVKKNIFAMQL